MTASTPTSVSADSCATGDYNSRILLLVDGHRLNDNVYDTAAMGTEFPVDLDLINHIEIVRGPGSSLYGNNAVFGVINIITYHPGQETVVEASSDFSSFLGRSQRVTAMTTYGRVSALLSGTRYRSAGESPLFFPVFALPDTNNGHAESMDGSHFEQAFANLHYGHFRLQAAIADRIKKFPTASYGTLFNNPADHIEDSRGYVDLSFHRDLSAQTGLDLRAYYDAYGFAGTGATEAPDSTNLTVAFMKARADWTGTEANVTRQIGVQRITLGAKYEYSLRIEQRDFYAGQPAFFNSNESPWLAAVYGEVELNQIPKIAIHAGGRIAWFSTFGKALSPRVALIYSPQSQTAVKYILAEAFRAPNAYEGYYADNFAILKPPRSLVPERILSNEIVFERSLTPWLAFTADAYYNQLQKLIDQVQANPQGQTWFVNDGLVHAKGIELELGAERASGLESHASFIPSVSERRGRTLGRQLPPRSA
jgi:outer membrane receptor for ferrienterochelin and colicins